MTPSAKILKRAERRCFYCGEEASTADHVQPTSRGGIRGIPNMVAACRTCNNDKGCMTLEEFRLYRFARHMLATGPAIAVINLINWLPEWKFWGELNGASRCVPVIKEERQAAFAASLGGA